MYSWGCSSVVERSIRIRDAPGSIPGVSTKFFKQRFGLVRELNPGPLAPEARIIPLDQAANKCISFGYVDGAGSTGVSAPCEASLLIA